MGCIETTERQPFNDPEHRQNNDFIALNGHQDVPHSRSVICPTRPYVIRSGQLDGTHDLSSDRNIINCRFNLDFACSRWAPK